MLEKRKVVRGQDILHMELTCTHCHAVSIVPLVKVTFETVNPLFQEPPLHYLDSGCLSCGKAWEKANPGLLAPLRGSLAALRQANTAGLTLIVQER